MASVLDDDNELLPFAAESQRKLEPPHAAAFEAWKLTPTPQTRTALLKSVQPTLESAARNYAGGNLSPGLRSQAKLLALRAFDSYDPQRGTLQKHLQSQLRGLQRYAAQEPQLISIPEQVSLDRQHLLLAESRLRDDLGRDPSDGEIADHTGLSLKRLGYIRQARPTTMSGAVLDGQPAQRVDHDPGEDAWRDFVYGDLGPVDQAILDYAYGLRGKPKLPIGQIARRLGVTSSAVSQRAGRIQKLLDERHATNTF